MTLRFFILRVAMLAVLPLIAFAGWLAYAHVQTSHKASREDAAMVGQNLAAAVDEHVASVIAALSILGESPLLDTADLAGFEENVWAFLHHYGAHVVLVAADGKPLLNTRFPQGAPLPTPNPPEAFAQVLATGRPVITDLFAGAGGGPPLLGIAIPVYRHGEIRYALAVAVSLQRLQDIVKRTVHPEGWYLGILDGRGQIIARNVDPVPVAGSRALPALIEAVRAGREEMFPSVSREGVPLLNLLVRTHNTPWSVAVGVPEAMLAAPAQRAAMALGGIGLLVLTAAALATVLSGRRLERALADLARGGTAKRTGIIEVDAANAMLRTAWADENRARAEAEKASLAKSRFLAGISHDLRQPYHAMGLFHDYLSRHVTDTKHRRALDGLGAAIGIGQDLLNGLLELSVLESGGATAKVEPVELAPLLRDLAQEFVANAQAKGLVLRVVPCSAVIVSDRTVLTRIIRNILGNAIKYTVSGRVLLGCRRRGAAMRIEVWDTGAGIAPDKLADIFEEFVQLDNADRAEVKGLGLGLAIAARSAKMLGHSIDVRSWPGCGSVFVIEVPLASVTPTSADTDDASLSLP